MRVAIVGNFGLGYKATMSARAVPIAIELARLGHPTSIFVPSDAPGDPPAPSAPGVWIISAGRVRSTIPLVRAVEHVVVGLGLTLRALRFRPDVLYVFKPKGYAGLALLLFWVLRALRLGTPVLALDADDWEGRGGWADREARPRPIAELISRHERWCLRHADVVTVASRALQDLAGRAAIYVPNAASPSSPGWIAGDRNQGRTVIGFGNAPLVLAYTRFFEFGPERLIAIFRAVRARMSEARFVVVGKGLANEDAELVALIKEHQLDRVVRTLGWVNAADLPDLFAAADAAVYPLDDTLLNRAKCPMKLVDLLLAGVPVVADDVGQAREYIADGCTGRLVRPGDVDAMADAVAELLRDPNRARALGAAARRAIPARWSWSTQARAIADAFKKDGGQT